MIARTAGSIWSKGKGEGGRRREEGGLIDGRDWAAGTRAGRAGQIDGEISSRRDGISVRPAGNRDALRPFSFFSLSLSVLFFSLFFLLR